MILIRGGGDLSSNVATVDNHEAFGELFEMMMVHLKLHPQTTKTFVFKNNTTDLYFGVLHDP